MKLFFCITLFFTLSCASIAQIKMPGKLNEAGFFEYKNNRFFYLHIAHFIKAKIDGETFSYAEQDGKKYVFSVDNYAIIGSTYNFDKMDAREILATFLSKNQAYHFNELNIQNSLVNDSILFTLNSMPKMEFYKKFVSKNGVLNSSPDNELNKAVLYKLLSSNIPIYRNDISGDLVVSISIISYSK